MENEEKVIGYFDRLSDAFDRIYEGEQYSLLYKLVDVLFRRAILQKRMEVILRFSGDVRDKQILDIGCGSGRYTIALGRRKPRLVLGIDISPSMIELAKERIKVDGLERVCRFENRDFLDKNFQDKFDIVIAAGVFDYTQKPQLFLSKMRNILKEKAILSFPIKWTLMTPLRMAWLFKRGCPNFYYTKKEIKKILNLCGFKIISIHRIGGFLVPGNYVVVCEPGGNE